MVRFCAWCKGPIPDTAHPASRFCQRKCRQAAFRLRRVSRLEQGHSEGPLVFSYADPPYPGLAARYYSDQDSYAGEVDHPRLIAELEAQRQGGEIAGWALSTSKKACRWLLPLCPEEAELCVWVKPIGACPATRGPHNCWEALIVVCGRRRQPGTRDWLAAQPARGGGELMGRKPIAFCAWLFELLGMEPGDELRDLFPGTGVVGTAWRELSSPGGDDAAKSSLAPPFLLESSCTLQQTEIQ